MAIAFVVRAQAQTEDQLFPALPYVNRQEYAQSVSLAETMNSGGGFTSLPPLGIFTTISALILIPDQPVTIRTHATDSGTLVNKGGIFLLSGVSITNAGNTAVQVSNASGNVVLLRGVALGS